MSRRNSVKKNCMVIDCYITIHIHRDAKASWRQSRFDGGSVLSSLPVFLIDKSSPSIERSGCFAATQVIRCSGDVRVENLSTYVELHHGGTGKCCE